MFDERDSIESNNYNNAVKRRSENYKNITQNKTQVPSV